MLCSLNTPLQKGYNRVLIGFCRTVHGILIGGIAFQTTPFARLNGLTFRKINGFKTILEIKCHGTSHDISPLRVVFWIRYFVLILNPISLIVAKRCNVVSLIMVVHYFLDSINEKKIFHH